MQLKELFDYQRFARNKKIEDMFSDVEKKYVSVKALSDEDLSNIAAAGEPFDTKDKKTDDDGQK